MKFLLFLIIISSTVFTSSTYIYDDRLKNLQSQINDVKKRVDDILKNCINATNSTSSNKGIITTFFHNNTTVDPHQNQTSTNSSTSNFFNELKGKIQKFFHIKNDAKNKDAVKIKRCLSKTVGRNGEKINEHVSNDDELRLLLMKFFKCLSLHGGILVNETEATSIEPPDIFISDISSTTESSTTDDDSENNTRTDAYLRYLASSKHSVEEIGRPNFKKPDLKKTQELIDNAKSSIWMSFEDEDVTTKSTTTTEEYENVPELPILKRETKKEAKEAKKDKRNGLFNGIINSVNDFQYEVPNVPINLEPTERFEEPIEEVNRLVEKIDYKQQEDLLKFLEQLNEKPKEFKFNVDKYFMLAFENLTKIGNEKSDDNESIAIGPRKYFEFDSGSKSKRNAKDKRIEKLKEKFVNQFKDHRNEKYVDFKKIVEHMHDNHVDNSFLDKTYQLNDGSIKTSELIKPLHLLNQIKSPKEVKLDMELDEKIKEIENEDFHSAGSENEAPFYKTEGKVEEIENFELVP